jgi:uncharacterized protein YidB (DUF937 family)
MSQLDDLLGGLLGGKGGGGLSDVLGGLTGGKGGSSGEGGAGGMVGALLPMLGGLLAGGGLNKILSGLQSQGLSSKADSWVGTGSNEPVTPGQVEQMIGADETAQIADRLGVSHEEAAQAIADVLPQLVDRVSPEGQLPPEEDLNQAFDRLAHSAAVT